MKALWRKASRLRHTPRTLAAVAVGLLLAAPAFAQGTSPWENAVQVLQTAFTSTIARGLSLVAIVVAGRPVPFCGGGGTRLLAGVRVRAGIGIRAGEVVAGGICRLL